MKRRLVAALWTLTVLGFLALLVKSFFADVYRVDSGSMRPTIYGGRARPDDPRPEAERVLVRYARGFAPERFDLVVTRSERDDVPLVKRVAGLPMETFAIRDGDLLIDGHLLAPDAPRPAPILVYDDRWFRPEDEFERRTDGSVRREGDAWIVEGSTEPPGNRLLYHRPLRDDYLDREHRRVAGVVDVNDAILELEFLVEGCPPAQRLSFQLFEAGDTFTLELATDAAGSAGLRLTRRNARLQSTSVGEELLLEAPLTIPADTFVPLRFANLDNHLTLELPTLGLRETVVYATNEPLPGQTSLAQHFGPRVAFGVQGGRARFRAVRILRDLYYTSAGKHGTEAPVLLGPDEYFLLGDNSAVSTDSRQFGPVQAHRLFGRPVAVVWPEPRRLAGAVLPE
jgi:signal peptidase I